MARIVMAYVVMAYIGRMLRSMDNMVQLLGSLEETKEYNEYRLQIEKKAMRVSLPKDTPVTGHHKMKS